MTYPRTVSSGPARGPSRRPVPKAIFWRRRLLLVAALIALAWIVVTIWPGGGDDDPPVVAPAPTASTSASASASSAEPTSGAGAQQDVTVRLTSADAACDPGTVRMSPTVPPGQDAGGAVRVELTLSTTSAKGCTLDPDDTDLVAVIASGDTAVWDSSVCSTALLDEPVALVPGWGTTVVTAWSGRGSGPACSSKEGYASPGGYTLRIGTLGGEPGGTSFSLATPPKKPKPSATPSATPSASASGSPSARPSATPDDDE